MDASHLLMEVPTFVRELVLGHWPATNVDDMSRRRDAYLQTSKTLGDSADQYEAQARSTESALTGDSGAASAQQHRSVSTAMRNQAAVCQDMGQQCGKLADSTLQTQHLLIAMGIALGAQLAYDTLMFFQGGGLKALADRVATEEAMRVVAEKFATEVAEDVAAGAARRAALHGAIHAAGVGALISAVAGVGAQVWDLLDGARHGFDMSSLLEQIAGGALGGAAGAEVGRRLAPSVMKMLSGRAESDAGRLLTHIGGTMLIGGAGGAAGGVAGAVPSLIIHHGDIHGIGDIFSALRDGVIMGFGGGFIGAATGALRPHEANAGAKAGSDDPKFSTLGVRQRDFAEHINDLLRSGEQPRVETVEPATGTGDPVQRLTFQDGTQVLHTVVSDPRHAHAQFLTSLAGDAVGAKVPAVHVLGDHVFTEVVHGSTGRDAYPLDPNAAERFHGTPAGLRLGTLDAVVGTPDRDAGSWMVDRSGDVWGIGHSGAFSDTGTIGPFARQFQEHGSGGEIVWKDHGLTRSEVQEIRQRVEQLSPVFAAAGHADWHDSMLHRVGMLEQHAAADGTSRVRVSSAVESSNGAGEFGSRGTGDPRKVITATPGNDRPPGTGPGRANHSEGPRNVVSHNGPVDRPPGRTPPQPGSEADGRGVVDAQPPGRTDRPAGSDTPTRPQLRLPEPPPPARSEYELAASPEGPGKTMFYRHPDGGHVEVVLTSPDGTRLPLRLIPGEEHVLGRVDGSLLLGQAPDSVSRTHATIKVDENGHVFLRDNSSMNGTFVDGKQLVSDGWIRVYDGQNVMLGREYELGMNFQRQMAEVRLFGPDGPSIQLYRGRHVDVGQRMIPEHSPIRTTVSRNHLRVGMDEDGRVWVQDIGSRNGTWVNNVRLDGDSRHYVDSGDSIRLGAYGAQVYFRPPDVTVDTGPVDLRFDAGAGAVPIRLEPGRAVPIGHSEQSPFAAQLRDAPGVVRNHGMLGLDHDGRVWISDLPGSPGVWVNGDRIATGQRVTLNEGDHIRIGPDFGGIAHLGDAARVESPPAAFHFDNRRRTPMELRPGEQTSIDYDLINGNVMVLGRPGRQILFGRDLDGRVWIQDPNPHSWADVRVNDERVPAGEKRYLQPDDTVDIGNVKANLRLGEEQPLSLRLSDDPNVPPLLLGRGGEVLIGSDPRSPMADQFAGHHTVSGRHATLYRDQYGDLWLRDEHSSGGTWVNNAKLDPNGSPVRLRPGDRIRFGEDWLGAAQYADDHSPEGPRTVPVKLNGPHGDISLDAKPGGEPITLGRNSPEFLPDGLPVTSHISNRHASIGVHPSGRVWIRDEGSMNHTYVNGKEIPPGVKVPLHPGDQVSLSRDYEFIVAFPPIDGGPFVNILDQTPETRQALADIARLRPDVYQRISDYLNAAPDGGIVVGKRPVKEQPGLEGFVRDNPGGPNGKLSWDRVAGLFTGGPRRLYVDSNDSGHDAGILVLHEFGHAADAAYGKGSHWLSHEQEWQSLHARILNEIGEHPKWWKYRDDPTEGFAEAFAAWSVGPKQLKKFACGNKQVVKMVREYFDRAFR